MRRLRLDTAVALALLALGACVRTGPPRRDLPVLARQPEESVTLDLLAIDPRTAGVAEWRPGAWARYEIGVRRRGQALVRRITYGIVAKEDRGFWVEIRDEWVPVEPADTPEAAHTPQAAPGRRPGERGEPAAEVGLPVRRVERLLLPFGPIEPARMIEQITLDPDGGVRKSVYVHRPEVRDTLIGFPASWTWVEREELETPKSRVTTHHYRRAGTNVWVSESAGPIGVVRAAGRGPLVNLVDWDDEGFTPSF